ncbi:hypothetical protein L3V27_23155 [Vibrio sp. J2-3(2022)]|uniref:hypothetical protein n=1 Tax=Vibrio sp. J2-3(2022) TaxID=2912261 RepID=UPI001F221F8B|nr:hypothetical protein [Vibrio sp. J2-3(2022)]MCF7373784.1 hypothetical protein [Vibrio sp. J2-3(2022)]
MPVNKCKECKSDINEEATKCAQCGSFQNWRRYFNSIAIVAGFILTWLSIWTAPPIKELRMDRNAEIKISILDGDFTQLTFMLSNIGNSPAALSQIMISSKLESGIKPTWYLYSELDKKLLLPNQAHVVKASNSSVIPSAVPHEFVVAYNERYGKAQANCHLVLEYIQLDGSKRFESLPFVCHPVDPSNESGLFEKN